MHIFNHVGYNPLFVTTYISLLFTAPKFNFTVFYLDENQKSEPGHAAAQRDDSSPVQDQAQQQSSHPEAAGDSSQVSASDGLSKLDPPDLADRSSQSSFTSQDGTGKHSQGSLTLVFR